MTAIEVEDLTKSYGETLANDHLTFSIESGEIFGYLGPNGSGKSTTIRQLMGFQSPTEGTATIFGEDVRDEQAFREIKARIGFLPGEPAFNESVSGMEFLDYQAELKGDARRDELLELFTPPLDRDIREYSTGNKQMLGIIQAFMHDPDLVIMDEPTSGLDPLKQEVFNDFISDECEQGLTVFLSSHVLSEVRRICDRVGIIREGELVELEDFETLLGQGGKRVRVDTTDAATEALAALDGVIEVSSFPDRVQFIYTGEYNVLLDELAKHDVSDIEISEPPLEDVFIHYYGGAGAEETDREMDTDV